MPKPLPISDVTFTSALPHDRVRGLLGWLEFVVAGALRIDGVAVRRTAAGIALAYPKRRDRAGHHHPVVAPVDAAARAAIEAAVFDAIGIDAARGGAS